MGTRSIIIGLLILFLIGFGGYILSWTATTSTTEPAPVTNQKKADSLYKQLLILEECMERVNNDELRSYRSCRPSRISLDPNHYIAEFLRIARRGLEAELQLPFF